MSSETNVKKEGLSYILTVAVITLMVGLSELLKEPEIIFPEIAALDTGALAAPRQVWNTDRKRMTVYIAICAVLGVLIVRYFPGGTWIKIVLAFSIVQMLFLNSKTSFAPMISAAALPVLLQTESWIYPISAVSLTLVICGIQMVLEKKSCYPEVRYSPGPPMSAETAKEGILRILCAAAAAAVVLPIGWRFCIAPPLLVAFTELSGKSGAGKNPYKVVALVALCAAEGTAMRLLIAEKAGMPLTLAALMASAGFLLLMYLFKMWMPPAGAMAILPMLLKVEYLPLYPLQVLMGISALTAMAVWLFHKRR